MRHWAHAPLLVLSHVIYRQSPIFSLVTKNLFQFTSNNVNNDTGSSNLNDFNGSYTVNDATGIYKVQESANGNRDELQDSNR